MKTSIKLAALAAVFVMPALSSAQVPAPAGSAAQPADQPVTRAQVREQLRQLEAAGYQPGRQDINYPDDLQAAEDRIAREQGSAYGAATSGISQTGTPAVPARDGDSPATRVYNGTGGQ